MRGLYAMMISFCLFVCLFVCSLVCCLWNLIHFCYRSRRLLVSTLTDVLLSLFIYSVAHWIIIESHNMHINYDDDDDDDDDDDMVAETGSVGWRREVVRITARIRLWWRHSILHHNSQTITKLISFRSHATTCVRTGSCQLQFDTEFTVIICLE